jgi:putative glutamine amidotransferase
MRKHGLRIALITALVYLAMGHLLAAQTLDRYLDQVNPDDGNVRMVIFNPTTFNISALVALRKNGILDVPNLTVIGVYHEKQTDDFAAARKFIAENKLDWFKLHAVSAEISEPVMFKANACTPEFAAIAKRADGVIFFGGPDIPPSIFHKKTNLLTGITNPYRHYFELSAIFHLLGGSQDDKFIPLMDARPGFPVLGICLGFQSLNVGTGGSLIQDIWTEFYGKSYVEDVITLSPEQWHSNPFPKLFPLDNIMGCNFHSLQIGDKGKFVTAMVFKISDHPKILSCHHQAVDALGKGLIAVATSRDGKIVEAVEHKKYPNVLGIQFHPEFPMLWDPESRYRQKPGDPLTSFNAILAETPPSMEFNKAIWKWFAAKLIASHVK